MDKITNLKAYYTDCVDFIEGIQEVNPDLYSQVEWTLEADPLLVVVLNTYVKITEWEKMSLRTMAVVTKKSYRSLKEIEKQLNED